MLMTEYNSFHPTTANRIWCPVMRHYLDEEDEERVIAAHIFPNRLEDEVMRLTLGDNSTAELFSARNRLMLTERNRSEVRQTSGPPVKGAFQIIVDSSILKEKTVFGEEAITFCGYRQE